jgi:hypothetical protein
VWEAGQMLFIGDAKYEDLIHWLEKDGGDIAILTEINAYWLKFQPHEQREEQSEGLLLQGQMRSRCSYNQNKTIPGTIQYGGVGVLRQWETQNRICGTGEDKMVLGCWTWIRYKGK